ncbi:MAG: hypothetical protein ABSD02_19830 [Steroidobacteraceae bacterium]|jgi:DNA-directed RNA polymerase subunit RPC12/RpoP
MTIRDFIKRRTRIFFGMAIAGWLVCAGSMIVSENAQCKPGCGNVRPAPPTGLFLGVPLFAGAILGMTFFIKCPRCSARLGQFSMQTPFSFGRQINFCPYCGVSFDEPCQKL